MTRDDVIRRGAFVVQVWSADGRTLLASSWPGLDLPLQPEPGFSDVRIGPKATQTHGASTPAEAEPAADMPRVQVVQNDGFRRHRIVRRALLESLPILLLLPITLLILLAHRLGRLALAARRRARRGGAGRGAARTSCRSPACRRKSRRW